MVCQRPQEDLVAPRGREPWLLIGGLLALLVVFAKAIASFSHLRGQLVTSLAKQDSAQFYSAIQASP